MIELDCMVEKLHLVAIQAMTGNNKNYPKKQNLLYAPSEGLPIIK